MSSCRRRTAGSIEDDVSQTVGEQSASAANNRSLWACSSGANSGTAMVPAYSAPRNPTT